MLDQKSLIPDKEGKAQKLKIQKTDQLRSIDHNTNLTSSRPHADTTGDADRRQSKHSEEQKQLNKSASRQKQAITFPHIPQKMNYGDKIFEKQSASTLQKTIVAYSVPKANRFNEGPKYTGEPTYCVDSCFRPNPTKGVGFGFGGKRQYPAWMERNMKENPSPGAYIESARQYKNKGPTFGISHKYYEKVLIAKEKHSSFQVSRNLSPLHNTIK